MWLPSRVPNGLCNYSTLLKVVKNLGKGAYRLEDQSVWNQKGFVLVSDALQLTPQAVMASTPHTSTQSTSASNFSPSPSSWTQLSVPRQLSPRRSSGARRQPIQLKDYVSC